MNTTRRKTALLKCVYLSWVTSSHIRFPLLNTFGWSHASDILPALFCHQFALPGENNQTGDAFNTVFLTHPCDRRIAMGHCQPWTMALPHVASHLRGTSVRRNKDDLDTLVLHLLVEISEDWGELLARRAPVGREVEKDKLAGLSKRSRGPICPHQVHPGQNLW